MKILIACEFSGIVRDAFIKRGHDAVSCDLLPTESPGPHYQGDVFDIINDNWDLMIAHPPCTYLCVSGLHWNGRVDGRAEKTRDAIEFVKQLWWSNIPKIAIENPVGCLSTQFMKPTQIIQPYDFGDDASKKTCLWLKNLPKLTPTTRFNGRIVNWNGKMVERWSNQTDSGQSNLGPSETRSMERSKTYLGIAKRMAELWG